MNEFAEDGPAETIWSALAPTFEAENVVAEEDGTHIMRHMVRDDLNDNEPILSNGTENDTFSLTLKYTIEAQKDIMPD